MNKLLLTAQDIQQKASSLGFDWENPLPVFDKVNEEVDELKEAYLHKTCSDQKEELGDLLFAVVNLARHLQICPEQALTMANEKFQSRFVKVQRMATEQNINMQSASPELLDALWEKAKRSE